jgi:3-oxoacyl-[acyl-carrier protein] reductase
MDLGLDGKVALVTGASQGIGFGIAKELAQEGARVALSSRTEARIEAAARAIKAAAREIEAAAGSGGDGDGDGDLVRAYVHDTTDLDAAPGLVEAVERDLGPIDILVTNTGGPPGGPPLEFTREQWETAHRELVIAAIEMIQLVVSGMRERGFGRVVSVSSSAAKEPIPGLLLSSAHRPGLLGAFKLLAKELASDGITLNTILPGRIATDRISHLHGSIERAQEVAREQIPAGRLGTAEEIAAAAAFLCSERAGYITGTYLLVDGGLTNSL